MARIHTPSCMRPTRRTGKPRRSHCGRISLRAFGSGWNISCSCCGRGPSGVGKMGTRRCVSLFGRKAETHHLPAEHLTAEHAVRAGARGPTLDESKLKASAPDNPRRDCLVGCAVAAGWTPPHPDAGRRLPGNHSVCTVDDDSAGGPRAHVWCTNRLPANAVLYREAEPLLRRPAGRSPNKTMLWYHDLGYQAGSSDKPPRVAAKIEHHKAPDVDRDRCAWASS
jgi:hypothetical protein